MPLIVLHGCVLSIRSQKKLFFVSFLWANVNFLVKGTIPGGQGAGAVSVPSASCARLRALSGRDKMEVEWGGKNTGQDREFKFIIKLFSNKNKMAHMLGKVQCLGLLVNHLY